MGDFGSLFGVTTSLVMLDGGSGIGGLTLIVAWITPPFGPPFTQGMPEKLLALTVAVQVPALVNVLGMVRHAPFVANELSNVVPSPHVIEP